jgi:hypothetical protein
MDSKQSGPSHGSQLLAEGQPKITESGNRIADDGIISARIDKKVRKRNVNEEKPLPMKADACVKYVD